MRTERERVGRERNLQCLGPGLDLSCQILNAHLSDGLQELMTGILVSIEPRLSSAESIATSTFYHIGHQSPLHKESKK